MNPASTNEFRENRSRFTLEQLQPYFGKWVAFSADGQRIVASAEGFLDLYNQLRDAKCDMHEVAFEYIAMDYGEIYLGSAELT